MNSKEYDGFSDSFRDSTTEGVTRANPAGAGVNNAGPAPSSQATPKTSSLDGAGQASEPRTTPGTRSSKAEPAPRPTRQAHQQPMSTATQEQQAEPHGTQPAPKSRMAVVWAALIVGAILLILLLVFVIQNNVSTEFEYFTWHFNLPLGVAMLLAAIAGALIMALAGSVRMIQMRWELHKLRRNQK